MNLDEQALQRLQRAIDEIAESQVASLMEEAALEARMRVRAILVDAIAERLIDRAEQHLRSASAPGPTRTSEQAAAPGARASRSDAAGPRATHGEPDRSREPAAQERQELAQYVYGVVAEGAELQRIVGIDGEHPVTVVSGEGLAAVTSLVPLSTFGEAALAEQLEDLGWLEENARRHEEIVGRIREQATLVPMRLCTIYRSAQSVREMLAREHHFLADALRRLHGSTEWGVKMFVSAELEPSGQPAEASTPLEQAPASAGPGERYLMGKRTARERRAQTASIADAWAEKAHQRMAALALEAKVNPLQPRELTKRDDEMLFNGVYLVEDGAASELDAVFARLRDELPRGITIELTGPWPPYNFVNSPTEVGR